jgi:hypothetical protein
MDNLKTLDEMYLGYLIYIRFLNVVIPDEDLIIENKYEYLQWSAMGNYKLYKLHHKHPLMSVQNIPKEDYDLIESHYQYLKLKYG